MDQTIRRDLPRFPLDELMARAATVAGPDTPSPEDGLRVVIGADDRGEPLWLDVGDLEQPHLLIAGGSGSGKSTLLDVILVQLVERNSPERLRIAMIDPRGRLAMRCDRLPHLFRPPVSEVEGASRLIGEVQAEMRRRGRLLAQHGCTDIHVYNRRVDTGVIAGEPIPFLLFIIDEATSLSNPVDPGSALGRELMDAYAGGLGDIAAKGRATGISLLLSVQRPSPEAIGRWVNGTVARRIVLRLNDPREAELASPVAGDRSATELRGRGDGLLYLASGTRRHFVAAWLPDRAGLDPELPDLGAREMIDRVVEAATAETADLAAWRERAIIAGWRRQMPDLDDPDLRDRRFAMVMTRARLLARLFPDLEVDPWSSDGAPPPSAEAWNQRIGASLAERTGGRPFEALRVVLDDAGRPTAQVTVMVREGDRWSAAGAGAPGEIDTVIGRALPEYVRLRRSRGR